VPHDFRLRFIGVIGASYLSDAALDDITVMSGSCGEGMLLFIDIHGYRRSPSKYSK